MNNIHNTFEAYLGTNRDRYREEFCDVTFELKKLNHEKIIFETVAIAKDLFVFERNYHWNYASINTDSLGKILNLMDEDNGCYIIVSGKIKIYN